MPVIIPTLTATSYLTNPPDQIAYVLRHYAAGPKSNTDTYYDMTASLANTMSKYGQDRARMAKLVEMDLQPIFNRLYPPPAEVAISITTADVPTNDPSILPTRYSIVVAVRVIIGSLVYSTTSRIAVNEGAITLPTDYTTSTLMR